MDFIPSKEGSVKLKGVHRNIVIMTVVFLLGAAVCFAEGPSFDCRKANTCVETLICNDKELSGLDKEMSEAYRSLLSRLEGKDKENVKLSQIRWIKARDKRFKPVLSLGEKEYCKQLNFSYSNEKAYYEDLYTNVYTRTN